MASYYLTESQRQTLLQILSLTSVENETVRELWQEFSVTPQYTIVEEPDPGEPGETRFGLKCPHCGEVAWDGHEDTVVVVDVGWRNSYFRFTAASNAVAGYYNDDYPEMETQHYECAFCNHKVALPDGFTEEGEN